jgi:uncharacterized protein (DUF427 family)
MSTIIIKTKDSGKVIAKGQLGTDIQSLEGNYYFKRDLVDLEGVSIEEKAYTCPIKKATCDYYFFKDQNGQNFPREACWIYDSIPNELFKSIEGWVGFYTRPPQNGLEVEIVEE